VSAGIPLQIWDWAEEPPDRESRASPRDQRNQSDLHDQEHRRRPGPDPLILKVTSQFDDVLSSFPPSAPLSCTSSTLRRKLTNIALQAPATSSDENQSESAIRESRANEDRREVV
jgi:hypothetical protein